MRVEKRNACLKSIKQPKLFRQAFFWIKKRTHFEYA